MFTDLSLFETDEARELLWVLQGMANSRNDRSIKRALASGLLGMTTSDFQQWMDQPREWDQWVGRFRDLSTIWREEGIYMALRRLFRETGAIERNLGRPDGERRVTNFLHLAEVLHHITTENPMSPSSILVWLQSKMDQSDRSQEEYQLRLESESESIRILTVHKSKGLEYPITFIPFLGFFNDRKKGSFRYHSETGELMVDLWELAQEENKERGRTEERREDARVLYVALTRASSGCYLYHPRAPPLMNYPMPRAPFRRDPQFCGISKRQPMGGAEWICYRDYSQFSFYSQSKRRDSRPFNPYQIPPS